jgi:hypothetical protein
MNTTQPTDWVAHYGYERNGAITTCTACGATFTNADGAIMRGHGRRCEVDPRFFQIPGVCNS